MSRRCYGGGTLSVHTGPCPGTVYSNWTLHGLPLHFAFNPMEAFGGVMHASKSDLIDLRNEVAKLKRDVDMLAQALSRYGVGDLRIIAKNERLLDRVESLEKDR